MTTENIAIFSDQRAANYDTFVYDWIPFYPQLLETIPSMLDLTMSPFQNSVLVVGSGTGNELLTLAQKRPDWALWGIDPSPDMVMQAHEKLAAFPQVQVREGYVADLAEIPAYSAATLLLVLHFLPDDGSKLDLLQQIAQRLQAGAPLIIADIYGTAQELGRNLEFLRAMLPPHLSADAVEDRIQALPQRIQHIPESRLAELLQESGFEPPRRFFQAAIYGGWLTRKVV
ncbi:MAG: class I SAM-dependent methyltransferase [Bacteroidota bacterium]